MSNDKNNKSHNKKSPSPKGGGPGFKVNIWFIYGAIILMFFGWSFLSGGFQKKDPININITQFYNYLEDGEFEKVDIYNKTRAEAFLTEEALESIDHEKVPKQ